MRDPSGFTYWVGGRPLGGPGAPAPPLTGWLHTEGNLIKDSANQPVMLRGIQTYVRLQNEQAKYTAAAVMGANVVRLGMHKQDIEGNPGATIPTQDQRGLPAIDDALLYARNAGLKVILDSHIWDFQVEPAPTDFFSNVSEQNSWLAMWTTLINRYVNNDTVIGVDLLNEPWSITPGSGNAEWQAIATNALNVLRPLNPNLIFFVSGWGLQTQPMWNDLSVLQAPNTAITDHIYLQRTFAFLQTRYSPFTSAGIAVWLGEIGFQASESGFMESQLDNFDTLGCHYTIFAYGINEWATPWDIVSATYVLTAIGVIYRDHLASL